MVFLSAVVISAAHGRVDRLQRHPVPLRHGPAGLVFRGEHRAVRGLDPFGRQWTPGGWRR